MPGELESLTFSKKSEEDAPNQSAEVTDLFIEGDISGLLEKKDNKLAEFLALIHFLGYKNFNPINQLAQDFLKTLNIEGIADLIDIDEVTVDYFNQQKKEFFEVDDTMKNVVFHKLMLPIREAILSNKHIPAEIQKVVVSGLAQPASSRNKSEVIDSEEDDLLREAFSNETLGEEVIEAAVERMSRDLASFDIVPFDKLKAADVDMNIVFLSVIANPKMDVQLMESKFAQIFFPDEDPARVAKCWGTLKEVTTFDNDYSFGTNGFNFHKYEMSLAIFSSVLQRFDTLLPLFEVIKTYGYKFQPYAADLSSSIGLSFSDDYLDGLIDLAEKSNGLEEDLIKIREILPNFKFVPTMKAAGSPAWKEGSREYFNANPYLVAWEQNAVGDSITAEVISPRSIEEIKTLAENLLAVMPDEWKVSFIPVYLRVMSMTLKMSQEPPEDIQNILNHLNELALSGAVAEEWKGFFETEYYEFSLQPEVENTGKLFDFLIACSSQVATTTEGTRSVESAATWTDFAIKCADIYRYQHSSEDDNQRQIDLAKSDLSLSFRALTKIDDPGLRDRASSELIYALTDPLLRDLQTARLIVEVVINSEGLKKEAAAEIALEEERERRGKSVTWKKIEKVKRVSKRNSDFMMALLGYATEEESMAAVAEHRRLFEVGGVARPAKTGELQLAALEAEVERIRETFTVTINISYENLLQLLNSDKVLSVWEKVEEQEKRDKEYAKKGKGSYLEKRDRIERRLGNRSKGGSTDPHPIYGAAATPNGRDEKVGGAGGGPYGDCFLTLKTSAIEQRTTFVYEDSFNGYSHWPVTWEEAIVLKAMHNLQMKQAGNTGFVEAQILGGVDLSCIESVTIPQSEVSAGLSKTDLDTLKGTLNPLNISLVVGENSA